jgi:hypothetical protein
MKRIALLFSVFALASLVMMGAEREVSSYYSFGFHSTSVDELSEKVAGDMESNGFKMIGEYHPESSKSFKVQTFTNDELIKVCSAVEDRGTLAAVFKVAYRKTAEGVELSIVNPEYIFRAYLRKEFEAKSPKLMKWDKSFKAVLAGYGSMKPFGGSIEEGDLVKYHYMMGMPYFDDPVELEEFDSYQAGRTVILNNLKKGVGNTALVYELKVPGKDISVFGIALHNPDEGEGRFLPIIGQRHIAAMPYEIILQGNEATMLHGRFRFALHWPELTMGTFTKIMSSPGDVEEFMEELCE